MVRKSETANVATAEAEDRRFDQTSILLHWLTVFLTVIQFTSIWAHEAVGHQSDLGVQLLSLHRLAGLMTWLVTAARLV